MKTKAKSKQELLDEIKRLEEQEKADGIKERLKEMKKSVGKGWCTHAISTYMTRGRAAYEFHAFFVDGAEIVDEEAVYVLRQVTIIKQSDHFSVKTEKSRYSTDLLFWLGSFRYEIEKRDFDKIYEESVAAVEVGIDHIRNANPVGYKVSGGDHIDQRASIKLLTDEGYTFIEMDKEEPLAFQLVRWKNHPYLYGEKLLNTPESFKIAKVIADQTEDNARSWGGSIWDRDKPRVDALRRFIRKYSDL